MRRKAIYSQLWQTSGKYPVNQRRRSNNQGSNTREFSMERGCTSPRAQENGCRLPLVSNFYLVKAKHWNLPVISQEQEKGKKSLKNILSWVGCQGWNQEHRSLLKETKLGRDEKGWKSWVTSEGIKDVEKLWNIVSQPSSGKWAQSLSMQELPVLWRVSVQGWEILQQQW